MYPTVFAALFLAAAAAPQPGSALEKFFVGRTEGAGTADIAITGKHWVRDKSSGRMDASGALLIDQVVEEEGKPARRRSWRLVRVGGNRVAGTISDVKGQVAGDLSGNTLHLKYVMKEGPKVEQWITLQPGGRTASNRMEFHRFGLHVATVKTTIRKVD